MSRLNSRFFIGLVLLSAGLVLALPVQAEDVPVRVVVWDEQQPAQKLAYENFLGNAIADYLKSRPGLSVKSVKLDDLDQGLEDETLQNCDVLIWWGMYGSARSNPRRLRN